ncbi:MAG: molybdopterin molybdotransferase MoeA [Bacteroidetes bacterium]|nr:molybdopterin molybdotransferase MoeA [Bacteroidota bacterium]MBU2586043.1 molybdopterin molybdotransferase MoeA [Bacteroidota bacterium]
MISYAEANKIVFEEFSRLKLEAEEVPLLESLNRILAEDVFADVNLPPFNNSAMDGFAIRYSENISRWKVVGEISAGNFSHFDIDAISAVGIMTGGKIPNNCDAVIPIEDVNENEGSIFLKTGVTLKKRNHIRKMGEDLKEGERALKKNTFIKPQHIAIGATCGKSKINVFRKLKIGVLATGDELIPITETPRDDKIRSSNVFTLISLIDQMSMTAIDLGLAKDNQTEIKEKITNGLKQNIDILITTGGISVGKYDLMHEIFSDIGVEKKFWRANIKPGKPVFFGVLTKSNKRALIFGLPGNPVSCFVNFLIFIRNNIEKLYGVESKHVINAELQNDLKKKDNKRHFMRGILSENVDGKRIVTSNFTQSSGNLAETSRANCLMVIEEERRDPKKGELVECIMM